MQDIRIQWQEEDNLYFQTECLKPGSWFQQIMNALMLKMLLNAKTHQNEEILR